MELRVVEIAHSKGMTMADIAMQIGISRVNLSNSLNGNPTLSRLTEVAKILGVEVAELFKTTPAEKRVSGYVEYQEIVYRIHSVEDLYNLVNIINTKQ